MQQILSSQDGFGGFITFSLSSPTLPSSLKLMLPPRNVTLPELSRLKRQFVTAQKKAITLGTIERGSLDWSEDGVGQRFVVFLEEQLQRWSIVVDTCGGWIWSLRLSPVIVQCTVSDIVHMYSNLSNNFNFPQSSCHLVIVLYICNISQRTLFWRSNEQGLLLFTVISVSLHLYIQVHTVEAPVTHTSIHP